MAIKKETHNHCKTTALIKIVKPLCLFFLIFLLSFSSLAERGNVHGPLPV